MREMPITMIKGPQAVNLLMGDITSMESKIEIKRK